MLPTVPGELLQTLKEKEHEKQGLLQTTDYEEVLFCDPPKGIWAILNAGSLICILMITLAPCVIIPGLYMHDIARPVILFPILGGLEFLIWLGIIKFMAFDWCCYRIITNLRVAEVSCTSNFLVSKSVRCSYFTTSLQLLAKNQLNIATDPKNTYTKSHLALIYKNHGRSSGKAEIHGYRSTFTFHVRDINALENTLIDIITKNTQGWTTKAFSMKTQIRHTSNLGYKLAAAAFFLTGGLVTASYYCAVYKVPLAIELAGGAIFCFCAGILMGHAQFEERRAVDNNGAFKLGDFDPEAVSTV